MVEMMLARTVLKLPRPAAPWRNSQPEAYAFVSRHLEERRARTVALKVLTSLFELMERFGQSPPAVAMADLEEAYARWSDNSGDPVHGWRYALPLALPLEDRRRVSRVIGAVVSASHPRLAGRSLAA